MVFALAKYSWQKQKKTKNRNDKVKHNLLIYYISFPGINNISRKHISLFHPIGKFCPPPHVLRMISAICSVVCCCMYTCILCDWFFGRRKTVKRKMYSVNREFESCVILHDVVTTSRIQLLYKRKKAIRTIINIQTKNSTYRLPVDLFFSAITQSRLFTCAHVRCDQIKIFILPFGRREHCYYTILTNERTSRVFGGHPSNVWAGMHKMWTINNKNKNYYIIKWSFVLWYFLFFFVIGIYLLIFLDSNE